MYVVDVTMSKTDDGAQPNQITTVSFSLWSVVRWKTDKMLYAVDYDNRTNSKGNENGENAQSGRVIRWFLTHSLPLSRSLACNCIRIRMYIW